MVKIFIIYYFFTLLFLLLAYVVGFLGMKAFHKRISVRKDLRMFLCFVLGVFLIVVFTAVFVAKGHTVMWFLLVPLGGLFFAKNDDPEGFHFHAIDLLKVIPFTLIFFAIEFFQYVKFDSGFTTYLQTNDNAYYITLVKSLWGTGRENYWGVYNLIGTEYQHPQPYHYFEIWAAVGISQIFDCIPAHAVKLVYLPVMASIFYVGVVAVIKKYKSSLGWKDYTFALMILGFTGITFDVFGEFMDLEVLKYLSLHHLFDQHNFKFIAIHVVVLAIVITYIYSYRKISFWFSLSLPVINAVIAPQYFGGMLLFFVYQKIKGKEVKVQHAIAVCLVLFGLIGYYYFQRSTALNFSLHSYGAMAPSVFKGGIWLGLKNLSIVFLKVFVNIPIKLVMVNLPLVGLFTYYYISHRDFFRIHKDLIILILLSILSSLASCFLIHENLDAAQMVVTGLYSLIYVTGILILIKLYIDSKYIAACFGVAISIIALYKTATMFLEERKELNIYSKSYLDEIYDVRRSLADDCLGGYLISENKLKGTAFLKNTNLNNAVGNFHANLNMYKPICLSVHEHVYGAGLKFLLYSQPYYRFWKAHAGKVNPELEFVKNYKLQYLVVEKGIEVPLAIRSIVKKYIIDAHTGEQFLLLYN